MINKENSMIHVEDLTKDFGELRAVDHIDLTIDKGEILGLLGPNGAGKTSTLRMLTGYLPPSSGTIRVKDFSIDKNLLEIKKCIGYLPESAPIYHGMLVFDYLEYVAAIRGLQGDEKTARMRDLADLCGLREIMHKSVGELSKGLNQRVGLAHAMMSDPEILVLDEPTSGLDPNQIAEIRKIVRRIGEEKTVILSTHILSEVEATCNRIVIINKGKIVADDSTHALKQSGGKENIIHLSLVNVSFDDAQSRLSAIEGINTIRQTSTEKEDRLDIQLGCRPQEDLREAIYTCVKETDWILIEFRQEIKTLETIFRELTKEN
jgi:ABC-2 type transport system ATP-binding protein